MKQGRVGRMAFFLLLAGSVLLPSSGRAENAITLADTYIPRLETMLLDNVASFWLDKAIDRPLGKAAPRFT